MNNKLLISTTFLFLMNTLYTQETTPLFLAAGNTPISPTQDAVGKTLLHDLLNQTSTNESLIHGRASAGLSYAQKEIVLKEDLKRAAYAASLIINGYDILLKDNEGQSAWELFCNKMHTPPSLRKVMMSAYIRKMLMQKKALSDFEKIDLENNHLYLLHMASYTENTAPMLTA